MNFTTHLRAIARVAAAVATVAVLALPAAAHEVKVGDLVLTNLWTRATPPKAPTAAGYLTITNNGTEADRLIGVATPVAAKGELHMMETKDGVMTMKQVKGGIEIPAGATVTLEPGGLHLMFIGVQQPIVEGESLPLTLTFEKAGSVETSLHVQAIGAGGMDMHEGHDAHEGMEGHDS